MCRPSCVNCIVPSHMLEGLLTHKRKKVRAMALDTLVLSERTRAERSLVRSNIVPALGGGKNRSIFDMSNAQFPLPGTLERQEGDGSTGDDAVDEAYDGLGDTYQYFSDIHNRDSLDGRGMRMDASVHYGTNYLNAFWNGAQMVFGDGDGRIFLRFTKSLDVIAHELAHGVTEHSSGLVYHNQPGALNESFSDVFGSLVKQYANDQSADDADWLIGNDIIGPDIDGVALRSMKNPGSAYDDAQLGGKDPQPKHMSDFKNLPDTREGDWGGVHINSGIPNQAFYLAATRIGGKSWTKTGKIWYKTLLALDRNSQFADCAAISSDIAARDYGTGSDEHYAVQQAWRDVGVSEEPAAMVDATKHESKRKGRVKVARKNLKGSLTKLASVLDDVLEAMEED